MSIFRTFSEADWDATPNPVREAFGALEKEYLRMSAASEKLENRIRKNSSNSNKPPSSDDPFRKRPGSEKPLKEKGKPGAKKGHSGHRQKLLTPTDTIPVKPTACACGNDSFQNITDYHIHQVIELPEIKMQITHFILQQGECPGCGAINKGEIPAGHQTGYGPRLSGLIGVLAGVMGTSRTEIQQFCGSVLNFPISLGGIQKVIDRVSDAITPHYQKIADRVRSSKTANIDETSFPKNGVLSWLWVMATSFASLFMIHPNRSRAAFEELIRDWAGILISDGYGVYRKWVGLRQTCLAHMIRSARDLSERTHPETAKFGKWALAELQRLCHMAKEPPNKKQWNAFYARLIRLIVLHRDRKDDAGRFARRLEREMRSLWLFLEEEGVAPTNNHAERMLRYAVLWRRRSQGTASTKGERWVERILSLRQTCRLQNKSPFVVLVNAMVAHFKSQKPDIGWIDALQ